MPCICENIDAQLTPFMNAASTSLCAIKQYAMRVQCTHGSPGRSPQLAMLSKEEMGETASEGTFMDELAFPRIGELAANAGCPDIHQGCTRLVYLLNFWRTC